MSEQNVEGNQERDSAAQDNVSGVVSQEASKTETDLKTELDALKSEIRGLQGKMDKDAQAIEKRLSGQFEQVASRLGVNLSPEQKMNLRVMELEEQLASVGQGAAKPQPQTVKETQGQPVDFTKIKQAYNDIDFNSPDVLRAVSENLTNEDGLLVALGKIKVGSVNKPRPTAASVATPSGSASASVDMSDLQAEYDRLLTADIANPENKKRRKEIIQQMQDIEKA